MTTVEDRLRDAFTAKAVQLDEKRLDQLAALRQGLTGEPAGTSFGLTGDSATAFEISAETDLEDDVTVLDARRPASPGRTARWLAPVLAAATVLALAVGVTAIARHSGTPRAGNSVGPALLGANQQADRSMIPWSQVDAGWTIALWTPTTLTSEQATATARPESVFLVNPIGGRYLVTTLTGDFRLKLADWSTDVRQALLIRQGEASSEVLRLDLASGLTQSFTTAGRVRLAKFTKPAGTSILLEPASGAVERVSLTGVHEITYPFSRTTDAINAYHPLSAPDGRSIVFDSDQGLVVRAEDGSPRRTIAAPSGMSACMPLRWWETGSVLASCHPAVGLITQLYVIPIGAAGPSTPLSAPTSPDYPFTLAWRLGSGVLADQLARRPDGDRLAVGHDRHLVAEPLGLLDVVGAHRQHRPRRGPSDAGRPGRLRAEPHREHREHGDLRDQPELREELRPRAGEPGSWNQPGDPAARTRVERRVGAGRLRVR